VSYKKVVAHDQLNRGSSYSMAEGRLLLHRQAERFGVQDVRVEPVQSKDIGKFVVPALGVTAAVILAGADTSLSSTFVTLPQHPAEPGCARCPMQPASPPAQHLLPSTAWHAPCQKSAAATSSSLLPRPLPRLNEADSDRCSALLAAGLTKASCRRNSTTP